MFFFGFLASLLNAKNLYGLFVKFRRVKDIEASIPVHANSRALPIIDALPPEHADMVRDNRVLLFEFQTNR